MIFKYICSCILLLLGWKFIDRNSLRYIKSRKKKVAVYNHTSYFDFFFFFMYKVLYTEFGDILFGVNEKWFNRFSFFFSKIGCIPVTNRTTGVHGGFVQNTVDFLKYKDSYCLGLSPEGTLQKSNWKGGYYYIASGLNEYENNKKKLSCDFKKEKIYIIPIGLDYENHCIFIGSSLDLDDYSCRETLEEDLQREMLYMTPLYPEKSLVCGTYETSPTFCDYPVLTTWISSVFCLYYLIPYNVVISFFFIICFFITFIYHYSEENYLIRLDRYYSRLWILIYTWSLWRDSLLTTQLIPQCTILAILSFFLYWKGCGRELTNNRKDSYILYHSLFHLVAGFLVVSPLFNRYH